MAERTYLRGGHGDDPRLEGCDEIGGVERTEFCGGKNKTFYELREGRTKTFECGQFGREGIYWRVFLSGNQQSRGSERASSPA